MFNPSHVNHLSLISIQCRSTRAIHIGFIVCLGSFRCAWQVTRIGPFASWFLKPLYYVRSGALNITDVMAQRRLKYDCDSPKCGGVFNPCFKLNLGLGSLLSPISLLSFLDDVQHRKG